MGRQLMSKAFRVNESGELLVNFSADRIGGAQVGRADVCPEVCVPFGKVGNTLNNRKYLTLTFPTDFTQFGQSPVNSDTSYFSPGTTRGSSFSLKPQVGKYSNIKQFLRGQYFQLAILSNIKICATAPDIEVIASLETS